MFNKEWLWMQKLNNMKAVGKYIVITEIIEQQKTESGILLTLDDSNQLRYKKGLIVIPGTDVSVVKKNDTVYYDKNAGHKMMLNDEVVTIITERDIVVVL
jgi:co-chaperonin GroES (HSP10)|tara:strand:+ start:262 stop:561 length:300 start_codon:yes stop_codon:yes gene_type:complete